MKAYTETQVKEFLKQQRHYCQTEFDKRSIQDELGNWYVACEDILKSQEPNMDQFLKEATEQPLQPKAKYHLKCNKCSNTFWSSNPFPELQLCPVCNNSYVIEQPSQPVGKLKSAEQILDDELSVNMVKTMLSVNDFKGCILDAMKEYHSQFLKVVLPSDTDIENHFLIEEPRGYGCSYYKGLVNGAKWIKEQLNK